MSRELKVPPGPLVNLGGRPRKNPPAYESWPIRQEPPSNVQTAIKQYAAEGRTMVGIASKLGTSDRVLRRWMQEDENLRWAFRVGRDEHQHKLVTILEQNAIEGEKPNINAIVMLKCMHGWREGAQDEQPTSRVNITFNLPGAMSREDFIKTVTHDHSGN